MGYLVFYGVILAVSGIGCLSYLSMASGIFYGELGATKVKILVDILAAIVDNISVMLAVLTMNPEMDISTTSNFSRSV